MRGTFSPIVLQAIYEAAQAVLSGTQSIDVLRGPLATCNELIELRNSPRGQTVVKVAKDIYTNYECDLEIDDETIVYHNGDGGYWVNAWVFVTDDESDGSDVTEDNTADLPTTVSQIIEQ